MISSNKDNKNNKRYTKEKEESLVQRMLPPENISTSLLSIETGISKSTLATWKSKATGGAASKSKRSMGTRDKFIIVMETYTLSEIDLQNIVESMVCMLKKSNNSILAA